MSETAASHWSIGEVLALLQDEFPEITISKIRFLESQGLIDPERTPSGYRRFYESDFDRLRWILVQQRDHYLPLKVIRDRLKAGEWESEGVQSEVLDLTDDAAVPVENLELAPAEIEAITLLTSDAEVRSEAQQEVDPWGTPEVPVQSGSPHQRPADSHETSANNAAPTGADADSGPDAGPGPDRAENPPPPGEGEAAPVVEKVLAEPERQSFTRDELAAEAGCDQRLLHELERFNLIAGRAAGSAQVFDDDAVEIAKAAVAFGSFGLEPRHLRAFRLGAEREIGLVAQIVEPMTHRRSPNAKRESTETLQAMSGLASTMREAMSRQLIREYFPEH